MTNNFDEYWKKYKNIQYHCKSITEWLEEVGDAMQHGMKLDEDQQHRLSIAMRHAADTCKKYKCPGYLKEENNTTVKKIGEIKSRHVKPLGIAKGSSEKGVDICGDRCQTACMWACQTECNFGCKGNAKAPPPLPKKSKTKK